MDEPASPLDGGTERALRERLLLDPEETVRSLIFGYGDTGPLARAEPADVAASLLFNVPRDDGLWRAFDTGCLALSIYFREEIGKASSVLREQLVLFCDRLLSVIRRTRPDRTVADFIARYVYWYSGLESGIIDPALDPLREYLRILAFTQSRSARGHSPRRLMGLWLDLCGEAGPRGRRNQSYLEVGLIGLEYLPLLEEHDSNEIVVCQGLLQWGAYQRPTRDLFLREWEKVAAKYPHHPTFWSLIADDVVESTEKALGVSHVDGTFETGRWWLESFGQSRLRARFGPAPLKFSERPRPVPDYEVREVATSMANPIQSVVGRAQNVIADLQRYADVTGDTNALVKGACNIGMRALEHHFEEKEKRGELAENLAREALTYAPDNPFAWSLWRDSLEAQGAIDAAEKIGWESIRRYPEESWKRSQLAKLLSGPAGKPIEAVSVLKEAMSQFPAEFTPPTQLAGVLARNLDRPEEAEAILRQAMKDFPDNELAYCELAIVLADKFGRFEEAEEVLNEYLRTTLPARGVEILLGRVSRREQLGRRVREYSRASGGRSKELGIDVSSALARRALHHAESSEAELREGGLKSIDELFRANSGVGYVHFAALRAGVPNVSAPAASSFAFAFEQAVRTGSGGQFEALIGRSSGLDAYVARAGLALVDATNGLEVPIAANDAVEGSVVRRFSTIANNVTSGRRGDRANRGAFLRLLSDFNASSLSLAMAV